MFELVENSASGDQIGKRTAWESILQQQYNLITVFIQYHIKIFLFEDNRRYLIQEGDR